MRVSYLWAAVIAAEDDDVVWRHLGRIGLEIMGGFGVYEKGEGSIS